MATMPSMATWQPTDRQEPQVRVGVILAEDAQTAITFGPTDVEYTVHAGGAAVATLAPGQRATVRLGGNAGTLETADKQQSVSWPVRIEPAAATEKIGVLHVEDIVAGRGFHWQKRQPQELAGSCEIFSAGGSLVLVNELPLEEYLAGVITAEMNAACPVELLKAQCVVARAWLLAMTETKHADDPFDRCNDDCCQRYQGCGDLSEAAQRAVVETRGEALLTDTGVVLDANYAKSCGGISEEPQAVWGIDKPGLTAVVDAPPDAPEHRFFPVTDDNLRDYLTGDWVSQARAFCSLNAVSLDDIGRYLGRVDETDDYFRWRVTQSAADLLATIKQHVPAADKLATLREIRVVERGVSGRASRVNVIGADAQGAAVEVTLDSEYRIRQALHPRFLYSSAILVEAEHDADGNLKEVTLHGAGWGHGVGLCQIGALGMALAGHDYRAICRHYYPTSTLEAVYA